MTELRIEDKHVVIATPADDRVATPFYVSIVDMMTHTILELPEGSKVPEVYTHCTSVLAWSRTALADAALRANATHILWIDSDMAFPKDMLLRFLRHSESLIGINAMARRPPYHCTAQYEAYEPVQTTADSSGLEKVARCGFGVFWMATEVLRAIDKPWFEFPWLPEKETYMGEDYYFLSKAHDAGYRVYIDHDLSKEVYHVGAYQFNPLMRKGKP